MSVPAYPRNTHLNDLIVVSRIYSEIRNTLYTIINTDSENNGDKRKSVFTSPPPEAEWSLVVYCPIQYKMFTVVLAL